MTDFPALGQKAPNFWRDQLKAYIDERAILPDKLADAIVDFVADNPDVIEEAAALAQSDAGLARKSDPGIPRSEVTDLGSDFAEIDDAGNLIRRVRLTNGANYMPRVEADRIEITDGPSTEVLQTVERYLKGSADAEGNYFEDVLDRDGKVPGWVIAAWESRMRSGTARGRGIICRGDSLTAGAFGEGVTYPGHLSTLVPGVPVAKRGFPGERSKGIAQRQGSIPLVTTAALTIPASGASSTFTMDQTALWTGPQGEQGVPDGSVLEGWLNGVAGRLSASGGTYTFTRTTSGNAVDVPVGTPWLDAWESTRRDWNQIIWTGRNNISDTSQVLESTAKMVAYQTAGSFVVVSITNRMTEPSGSAGYNSIIATNTALASAYPENYFDLRKWLINNGLAAVGLTPTTEDTLAISEDRIPPALLAADGLHFNPNGYRATAIGVRSFITTKGWI